MSNRSPASVSPKSQRPDAMDPDIARLNIPISAIKELQALVNTPLKPVEDRGKTAPRERLFASILTMISVAVVEQAILQFAAPFFPCVAGFCAFGTAWFLFVWYQVHGRGLCRRRVALLNERNFLDTYKIHNREFGHLFQPEPDTPGNNSNCCGPPPENVGESPVQTVGKELIEDQQKNQFQDAVTQHYGGMYGNVKRVQAELSLLDRANKANADRDPNAPLVPANIPLPGESVPKKKEA